MTEFAPAPTPGPLVPEEGTADLQAYSFDRYPSLAVLLPDRLPLAVYLPLFPYICLFRDWVTVGGLRECSVLHFRVDFYVLAKN